MNQYPAGQIPFDPEEKKDELTTQLSEFGEDPIIGQCPSCGTQAMTETKKKPGLMTAIASGLCCLNPW